MIEKCVFFFFFFSLCRFLSLYLFCQSSQMNVRYVSVGFSENDKIHSESNAVWFHWNNYARIAKHEKTSLPTPSSFFCFLGVLCQHTHMRARFWSCIFFRLFVMQFVFFFFFFFLVCHLPLQFFSFPTRTHMNLFIFSLNRWLFFLSMH